MFKNIRNRIETLMSKEERDIQLKKVSIAEQMAQGIKAQLDIQLKNHEDEKAFYMEVLAVLKSIDAKITKLEKAAEN